MTKTINRADMAQKFAIYELLKQYVIRLEDGTVEYTEGLSDDAIAGMVEGANRRNVEIIRQSQFGNLAHRRSSKQEFSARVDATEKQIADLLNRVARLEGLFDKELSS